MKVSLVNLKTFKKSKHFKLYSILIVFFLLILLGGIIFSYTSQNQSRFPLEKTDQSQGWGQRPDGTQDFGGPPSTTKKPRWNGPIPNPPKEKITYYKGLWGATWIYPEEYTGLKLAPEKYKSWGVNIINLAPGFEINKKGEVRYPLDFPTYEDLDARIGELAEKFYQAGIHLAITVQIHYKEEFVRGNEWGGDTAFIPKEKIQTPGYLINYDQIVEQMAKIAEKYHLEMFSPMNEPENIFLDAKLASDWSQRILPKIKKYYKGKIFYKGDLHKGEGEGMNFKGYDVLGIMPNPGNPPSDTTALRKIIVSNIDKGLAWAEKDGVPQVVVAEYGFKGKDEMWPTEYISIVLEEGSKKLNGVFLTEPPPVVLNTIQGKEIIKEIQRWFLP